MKISRRQLMVASGVVASASLMGCGSLANAAQGTQLTKEAIQADPVFRTVASFVGKYSQNPEFRVVQKSNERHCSVHADVTDLQRFVEAMSIEGGLPFGTIWCKGNRMTFQYNGTFFALTNKM